MINIKLYSFGINEDLKPFENIDLFVIGKILFIPNISDS